MLRFLIAYFIRYTALALGLMMPLAGAHAATYLTKHCEDLDGKAVPASIIGLPTRGAQVFSATVIKAAAPGNRNGEYCRITGYIRALQDTTPPDIRFEVNLPTRWNSRALQMGGGYNGTIVPAPSRWPSRRTRRRSRAATPPSAPIPATRATRAARTSR